MAKRFLIVLGTRPEAIKLCPLALALRAEKTTPAVHVCCTGQHRELLTTVWDSFGMQPDSNLDVMSPGQSLSESSSRILTALPKVFDNFQPDFVVVQGDTTTTLCGALAAFYHRTPVGHVEAGLRTWDPAAPYPEEINRTLVARIAALHFAATSGARENLLQEGIPAERIHVTGNTGIDALLHICRGLDRGTLRPPVSFGTPTRRRVVVTMHRREALDGGMVSICRAIRRLATEFDLELVLPIHPNPRVRAIVERELTAGQHVTICDPLDYVSFVALMRTADLVLTDSGGVQEEAPYLGLPVVVLREKTERPEGAVAGLAKLVGYDGDSILEACREVLKTGRGSGLENNSHQIYGDGSASARIRDLLLSF